MVMVSFLVGWFQPANRLSSGPGIDHEALLGNRTTIIRREKQREMRDDLLGRQTLAKYRPGLAE